jgi:prepilin-type N-terminal cleavage/methylation domain-containing protein/prepilin-type processing-associated H-X9-DG protein
MCGKLTEQKLRFTLIELLVVIAIIAILTADVRTRGSWRENPSDVPHDGTGNVLLTDGSVQSLSDAFGPDVPLQEWGWRGPVQGDRNGKPYHPYGACWWVWAAAQIRGESVAP